MGRVFYTTFVEGDQAAICIRTPLPSTPKSMEAAPHSAAEKTSLGYIVSVSQLVVTVANSERRNCNGMAQGGNDVDELADVLTQLLVGGLQLRESLGDRLWVTWGW